MDFELIWVALLKYTPLPKIGWELKSIKGVSTDTSTVSRSVHYALENLKKLPDTDPNKVKIFKELKNIRWEARAMSKLFVWLTIIEGNYNMAAITYCSAACCSGSLK